MLLVSCRYVSSHRRQAMKQKTVIKVPMPCNRCRSKAMAVAAKADGVTSMEITGDASRLEVVGDGVDPVCLAYCLRKKLRHAEILQVEEVKEKKPKEEKKPEEPKPPQPVAVRPPPLLQCYCYPGGYCYCYPGGFCYCHPHTTPPPPQCDCTGGCCRSYHHRSAPVVFCEESGFGGCLIM